MVCVDGSDNSVHAFNEALILAKAFSQVAHTTLYIVTAIHLKGKKMYHHDVHTILRDPSHADQKVRSSALELLTKLEQIAKEDNINCVPILSSEHRDARSALLHEVEVVSPDYLILGRRGRGKIFR